MNFKDLKRNYINSDPTSEAALEKKFLNQIEFKCMKKTSPRTDKKVWSITITYKGKEADFVVISSRRPTIETFLQRIIVLANQARSNDYLSWCKINTIAPDEAAEELYEKYQKKADLIMNLFGEDIDPILEEIERDGYSCL